MMPVYWVQAYHQNHPIRALAHAVVATITRSTARASTAQRQDDQCLTAGIRVRLPGDYGARCDGVKQAMPQRIGEQLFFVVMASKTRWMAAVVNQPVSFPSRLPGESDDIAAATMAIQPRCGKVGKWIRAAVRQGIKARIPVAE